MGSLGWWGCVVSRLIDMELFGYDVCADVLGAAVLRLVMFLAIPSSVVYCLGSFCE